jgi:NADH-quinone oxidoreductase subunit G
MLATWKLLVDDGRLLDGDDYLKATGRRPEVLVSAGTLARLGVAEGAPVRLATERGSVELPVGVADLPDHVVWAPTSAVGLSLNQALGVSASGAHVTVTPAVAEVPATAGPQGEEYRP